MHKVTYAYTIKDRLLKLSSLRHFELKALYADVCHIHGGDIDIAYIKGAIVEEGFLRRQIGLYAAFMLAGNSTFAANALEKVVIRADEDNEAWQRRQIAA